MTDTPPVPSAPAPPITPVRGPSAASGTWLRCAPPITSFDTGIPGVPLITAAGVQVPTVLVEQVLEAATANHVTLTEG